jgi:hypothetical protein
MSRIDVDLADPKFPLLRLSLLAVGEVWADPMSHESSPTSVHRLSRSQVAARETTPLPPCPGRTVTCRFGPTSRGPNAAL